MTPSTAPAGCSILAGQSVEGRAGSLRAEDPATGEALEPAWSLLEPSQLRRATAAAEEAFDSFRAVEPERRAALLECIARHLEQVGEALVDRARAETGLPEARLVGERARTSAQLRLFAQVVRAGEHHDVHIDPALPERTPLPRADIRRRTVPVGPVAVFGASNFPLAFSVAGGDTASALAAGCPVVVKAHDAHPGTSEIVGRAITEAVQETGMHPGVFSLVYGESPAIGQALVADPAIRAVGFTGSRRGGLALMAVAAARPVPIPVFAEMSSINPVLLLEGALRGDHTELVAGCLASVTGSAGQLCTAPGLLCVPAGPDGDRFVEALSAAIAGSRGQTMLTRGIAEARERGLARLASRDGVTVLARGQEGETANAPAPVLLAAAAERLQEDEVLQSEIFGAVCLVVRHDSAAELAAVMEGLEGQLTATLHLAESDHAEAAALLPVLERRAGRIVVGGWPTGVEVGHAMVHGGPFPATSDGRSTSVGTHAIARFLRPVAYQGLPEALLPAPVQEENPWSLPRRIDGRHEGPGTR
ncbi:aldehyde dehydrogenase (NADP(+)) [Brachybacterium saurashtrense]|uniref:Aldehyde dehydrogenase (NADP(+)) n=1 Tax=Brachybacterium saurashtrense TaxID=556288 RepID=A0A345YMS2_9MICO|nr:aldehyde dehydrogenase (NADP(+)) [Brachybacterium saurashtrense]AXK45224.1 aldehyde dehydrogenase (NADP(+)) [Brachybacterium saurashtrense]RRR22022.1 aldehyde dehydrogenase (NADP(+)) [Brachybacterium saurashtrense]